MTQIYSYLPPIHSDPQEVLLLVPRSVAECARLRKTCSPWPWKIEELNNTIWRNLHNGEIAHVRFTAEYRGKPVLDTRMMLGFWDNDRFIVECWVRVDHLPLTTQLAWYGVEVAYWRSQVARWCKEIDALPAAQEDTSLSHLKANWAKAQRARRRLDVALLHARNFAVSYGLGTEVIGILNAGVQCNGNAAGVQMAML